MVSGLISWVRPLVVCAWHGRLRLRILLILVPSTDGNSIAYIVIVATTIAPGIIRWILRLGDRTRTSVASVCVSGILQPNPHSLHATRILVLVAKGRRVVMTLIIVAPSRRIVPLLLLKPLAETERVSGSVGVRVWGGVLGSDGREWVVGHPRWELALERSPCWVHLEWQVELNWIRWELGHCDGGFGATSANTPTNGRCFVFPVEKVKSARVAWKQL